MQTLALFNMIGPPEWLAIGVVALLVFGSRLPEVGKNLGKSLVEFKNGLKGTQGDLDEVNSAVGEVSDEFRRSTAELDNDDESESKKAST